MVLIALGKVLQNVVFNVFNKLLVAPQVVEPSLQIGAVTIAIDDQIEFDIAVDCGKA